MMSNTLAYYITELDRVVKSYMVQSPEAVFLVVCDPSVNEL